MLGFKWVASSLIHSPCTHQMHTHTTPHSMPVLQILVVAATTQCLQPSCTPHHGQARQAYAILPVSGWHALSALAMPALLSSSLASGHPCVLYCLPAGQANCGVLPPRLHQCQEWAQVTNSTQVTCSPLSCCNAQSQAACVSQSNQSCIDTGPSFTQCGYPQACPSGAWVGGSDLP